MVAALGPSSEAEVLALLGPADDKALMAEGARHATEKIAKDVVRFVVRAHTWFHDPAVSETTRARVRYEPDNLRVLAWAAAQDAEIAKRFATGGARRGARKVALKQAAEVLREARAHREQLADALIRVVGVRSAEAAGVDAARRPGVANAVDLSLDALVAIGRRCLASRDAGTQRRVKANRLDAAWLDTCAALVPGARAARKVVESPAAAQVTQETVDRWDGIVLLLLDAVMRAFNHANAVDPAVPRLAWVSLRARKARVADAEGEK